MPLRYGEQPQETTVFTSVSLCLRVTGGLGGFGGPASRGTPGATGVGASKHVKSGPSNWPPTFFHPATCRLDGSTRLFLFLCKLIDIDYRSITRIEPVVLFISAVSCCWPTVHNNRAQSMLKILCVPSRRLEPFFSCFTQRPNASEPFFGGQSRAALQMVYLIVRTTNYVHPSSSGRRHGVYMRLFALY